MNLHDLRLRAAALFFRSRVEDEMEDELGFHLEMETRKNLARGMSPRDAELQARIEFGGRDVARESCRDERRTQVVENLLKDLRYALRGFRRTPAFALAVIGTIALGLGWNTAVFTIFNAYVLRPLAVRDPHALYQLSWMERNGREHSLGWQEFLDVQEQQHSFTQMAAYKPDSTRLEGRFAQVTSVSGGYFEMLGVPAFMGRTLVAGDSGSAVLVLSYAAWRNRFAADPAIIGRKLSVRGVPYEVVGVMPESFSGHDTRFRFDLWTPLVPSSLTATDQITVAARLDRHVTLQHAHSELAVLIPRVAMLASGAQRTPISIFLWSMATTVRPSALIAAILLVAIPFGMVFLSACANVANMMMARALSRQREIGIRLSLGAGRSRLIQQLLVESLMLALPAALMGFVMARGMIVLGESALFATIPPNFLEYIRIAPLAPDVRVFGFVLAAAVASALLFGLAPALQATRLNLVQAAHGQFNGSAQPSRLRNVLVTAQVTVSALFLIMCGVFIRGANLVQKLDTGMRTRDVMEIEVQDRSRAAAVRKLSAAPGVGMLAAAAHPPLDSHLPTALAVRAGSEESIHLPYTYVSPAYFPVFDLRVVRGRNFTVDEARAKAPVAVLSESAARKLFPGRDAIGEPVRVSPDAGPPIQALVIGVSRDSSIYLDDADQGRTCLYLPSPLDSPGAVLLARVPDTPEAANRRIRALLEDGDPGAVERIDPMQSFVDVRDYPFRALYWISAAVGAIALLFTLSGIYGVVSHAVAQRTKEIGIRMALGASVRTVTHLVVGQSVRLAGWGIVIGAVLALAASKVLSTQVFIRPFDGWAYLAAILLVMLACVAAAVFPARRVARVDPLATLRHD